MGRSAQELATDLTLQRGGGATEGRLPPRPARGPAVGGTASAGRPAVIQSELWQVLQIVRASAELSYARRFDLVELDRRILLLLQAVGPLVPAELAGAAGVDKAQVSRAVKRLLALRLVGRQQIRSPLKLTRKGGRTAARLLSLADDRNRELTCGIGDAELAEFLAIIEILLDRAALLYEQERDLAAVRPDVPPRAEERRPAEPILIDRSRIVSPLTTLSAYFSRSGALAYRRLTGLSKFEAFVLSEIGLDPPVEWPALVAVLQRDHSQAGRTVKALVERGLIRREGKPGRRHGAFAPTESGAQLHRMIHDAGRERNAFLLAPLDQTQRARFRTTLDRIGRNAAAQLERERTAAP